MPVLVVAGGWTPTGSDVERGNNNSYAAQLIHNGVQFSGIVGKVCARLSGGAAASAAAAGMLCEVAKENKREQQWRQ